MNWETQLRTQLLKRLAGFCRVTTKLGKADWTQKSSSLSELLALERKGDAAQNQDISNKPLQSLRHRQASVLLLHSSECTLAQRWACVNETDCCLCTWSKPNQQEIPNNHKTSLCILREFSRGGVRMEVTSSTAPNPSLEGFLNTLVGSSPCTLRKCCCGHIPLYRHHHHQNMTRRDFSLCI